MAGTFRKKFGQIPERPQKRSHLRLPEHFQNSLPSVRLETPFFSEVVPERPLRAGHGIRSSAEGISDFRVP